MSDRYRHILKILARTASFVAGIVLLSYSLLDLAFWGCHDSGGFCAGHVQNDLIVSSAIFYSVGVMLVVLAFTLKLKKFFISIAILLLLFAFIVLPGLLNN